MQTFLDHVAEYVIKTYPDRFSELCVVFPNRRAGLFFKAALARRMDKPFWSPEIFSIEDLIVKLADVEMIDPIAQLFELYEVYRDFEKEKAESFDQFTKWGQILLSDFNDIDSYLVNAKDLFGNLRNIKELESWSLLGPDITPFQQDYLHFWESTGKYYTEFTERLLKNRRAYQGLAYRIVAEQAAEKIKQHPWHKIIFAGFNALNAAEEKFFRELISLGKAETLWDTDSYYMDDKIQEAGRFLRRHKEKDHFKINSKEEFQWMGNDLIADQKRITVTGVSKNVGQAKFAGQLISDFLKSNPQTNLTQTAIVLADENLLFPVLHSLPEEVSNVNVTMGYPLKNTPISGFSELLFQLHENARRFNRKGQFYHHDVINLLNHPYAKLLLDTSSESVTQRLVNYLQQKNIVFCTLKTFDPVISESVSDKAPLLNMFFNRWSTVELIFDCLYSLIDSLKERSVEQWNKKYNSDTTRTNLELEYLFAYSKIIKRIKSLSESYSAIENIKIFRGLLKQLIHTTNLSFYGEPVSGLQVMGVLETRTLDFENIILLSANEGLLPSGKAQNSFIPFDVRRVFGLPTYSEKDSIFAYHFYRLLQRAKSIHIMYNTESDNLGGGEKSRFLTQLLYEFPQVNKESTINEQLLEVSIQQQPGEMPIAIRKTDDILDVIYKKGEEGFSPSLLNVYRNCSLKFYFHLVGQLKETDEVEETIGADTLGNVIHQTLEEFYKPIVGRALTGNDLKEMKGQLEQKLKLNFEAYYPAEDLAYGKNLLTLKVTNKFIQGFLDKEIEIVMELSKQKATLIISQLERTFESKITVGNKVVNTKGKIDRVDVFDKTLRIIDYKTGRTEDKELNLKGWGLLGHDLSLNKSFQLLMYAWLYHKSNTGKNSNGVQSGIISFRQLSAGLKTVKIVDSDNIKPEHLQEFEKVLKSILEEIYDPAVSFSKTTDKAVCEYCDFKTICNR